MRVYCKEDRMTESESRRRRIYGGVILGAGALIVAAALGWSTSKERYKDEYSVGYIDGSLKGYVGGVKRDPEEPIRAIQNNPHLPDASKEGLIEMLKKVTEDPSKVHVLEEFLEEGNRLEREARKR